MNRGESLNVEKQTSGALAGVKSRPGRNLLRILGAGGLLLGVAVGVRIWWSLGAPARAARIAAATRAQAVQARLQAGEDAVRTRPGDFAAYNELATAQLAVGQEEEALATWRRGRDAAPKNPMAWMALANGYLGERRLAAAEETYAEMTRRFPKFGAAQQGLAVVRRHSGRYRQALAPARRAVELSPNQPENRYVLGAIIEEMVSRLAFPGGQGPLLEEGRAHLARVATALPNHPDVAYRRGKICMLLRKVDEANASLEQAARITPGRAVVWLALTEARMRKSDVDGAIAAAREARRLEPMEPQAPLALGKALLLKSDRKSLEDAAASLQEAVRLNPDGAEGHDRLGTALIRLERLTDARTAFERAMALEPSNPYPVQQLAQIYRRQGDNKLALDAAKQASILATNDSLLRQVQRASAMHPENWKIHLALGDRYRDLGWLAQAADEYQMAVALVPTEPRAVRGLAAVRKLQAERSAR